MPSKKKWRETYDGALIVIERSPDDTFKVTVTRKREFVGDACGFATKDYAYNYGIRLLGEFPETSSGKGRAPRA